MLTHCGAALTMHFMLASIAILTLFGILLIMLETFVPGWVAGILGVISILTAVAVALTADELAGWTYGGRLTLALFILVFSSVILIVWLRWFAVKAFRRRLTLTASIASPQPSVVALGSQGVALTELRPLGRADIAGKHYEVRCQDGMAAAGSRLEVIASEPGNLLVRLVSV
ncbi:NfeD family protein [Prosthecobacter sp.]|uniref:NfeD family protein n=1 Tax=Prosthecobacter sp. TaxID=1965333 RepID=UPI001D1D55D0|nr:NfeD family protein [Prosthecobacter sp.]MCB1275802.1 NfeD family protein [Prosthecobacter sp.]